MLIRSSLVVVILAALTACDKVPLGAPSSSTIRVTSANRSIPANGSTEISATVTEASGTPVQNGTTVTFTTNLGRLDPVNALTVNGVATTTLHGEGTSGVAQVRATSGAAAGDASTIDINVGAASASAVTVSASSLTVPSAGGTVSITAVVTDAQGNRVRGAPVVFTTTAGSLSPPSVETNTNGEATVSLTTDRTATVSARAGGQTATVTVTAQSTTLALATAPATPVAGQAVTLTVTPTIATGGATPRVSVNWGDGTIEDLGFVSAARSATHVYGSAGTYRIEATATTGSDETRATTEVIVTPRPAVGVNITSNPATPGLNATTTFTATLTGDTTASAVSYRWTFPDDATGPSEVETSGNTTTTAFTSSGEKTVSVTVTLTDGRTATSQISFRVP